MPASRNATFSASSIVAGAAVTATKFSAGEKAVIVLPSR
ncbi:MAG: hypothetical protein AW07_03558 [Candidatus Accumulibacter sp. SK-11]|nr:MAG: hypothetical protein AW07_03558 [Candidatus Accumulibacter sp. SK-11]